MLLLADVFESFIEIYGLYLSRFVSAPNLTWNAFVKMTSNKLELLTDIDLLLMLKKGIRGKICQAIIPFIKANNKYVKNHDELLLSSFLKCLDANKLYGWAMCKKLLYSSFKFVDPSYFDEDLIRNNDEDKSDYSFVFEVDIEYPKEVALKNEDIAFLPKRKKLNDVEKLVTTLDDKENHRDIKLVTPKEKLIENAIEPNLMNIKCFSEDLSAVEMRKTEIKRNKPVYLGQSILDISKTLMYEFYHNYLKKKYGDKIKLCYTDTDSFFIHALTEDFYKDISDDVKERFDTNNYDKNTNRPIAVHINKKVLGMMKDKLDNNEMVKSVNVCSNFILT